MGRFILRWLFNSVAVYVAAAFVPGIHLQSATWMTFVWLGLIFSLLNMLVRPLLKLLTFPLIILTLGLFTLLINTFLFWLAGAIGMNWLVGFTVDGFWPAFLGGLVMTLVNLVLVGIFREARKD